MARTRRITVPISDEDGAAIGEVWKLLGMTRKQWHELPESQRLIRSAMFTARLAKTVTEVKDEEENG